MDLLKKSKNKPKEVKSNREIIIDPTEIAEKNCRKFNSSFHKDEKNNPKEQHLQQANVRTFEIKNEISLFRKLILEEDMIGEDCISTRRFWLTYRTQLPNLFSLTKILLNIQASTAFVERYFSICGITCNVRNTNMADQTIIMRSVLKSNIETLDNLAHEEEQDDE